MSETPTRREALLGTAAAAAALTVTASEAQARQIHMESALQHLRQARAQLEEATPNKGGHRRKAISLVDSAIGEVQAGIRYSGA